MIGSQPSLRAYPLPSKGYLLLVCRKCQKKITRSAPKAELANLKKALKHRAKSGGTRLSLLQVPCLKLCPKDAVTVCTTHQLAHAKCSILRSAADLDALLTQCHAEAQAQAYTAAPTPSFIARSSAISLP